MEWSIRQIARLAGTTSRTLRHYDQLGVLPPSRVGDNGYRYYDSEALLRLQQILLLRELGVDLATIARMLEGQSDHRVALTGHLERLREERLGLERRIRSVESTIGRLERGEDLMAEEMLDGFDHTRYRDEVIERWGEQAAEESARWWDGQSAEEQADFKTVWTALARDWSHAAEGGLDPSGGPAQALARRHCDWLSDIPGTPRNDGRPSRAYFEGLAEMYVTDERFARHFGGRESAEFVREAMKCFAERELSA